MAATKVYEVADGVAITAKGVILNEGEEVTADNFESEAAFNALVKAGKIVQVTSTGKKRAGKTSASPSSSTGAAEPEAESTEPDGDEADGSENGNAGDGADEAGE